MVKIVEEMSVGAEEQMEELEAQVEKLERENQELQQRLRSLEEGDEWEWIVRSEEYVESEFDLAFHFIRFTFDVVYDLWLITWLDSNFYTRCFLFPIAVNASYVIHFHNASHLRMFFIRLWSYLSYYFCIAASFSL